MMLNLEVSKEGCKKKTTEAIDPLTLKPLKTLSDKLSRLERNSYSEFGKTFLTVLNKKAPLKTKFLRHNSNPFISKELRKAIMKRSQLKNSTSKTEITKTGVYIKNKGIFV